MLKCEDFGSRMFENTKLGLWIVNNIQHQYPSPTSIVSIRRQQMCKSLSKKHNHDFSRMKMTSWLTIFLSTINFETNQSSLNLNNQCLKLPNEENPWRIVNPGLVIQDKTLIFEGWLRVHLLLVCVYKRYRTYSKLRWKRFLLSRGCIFIYLSFQSVYP